MSMNALVLALYKESFERNKDAYMAAATASIIHGERQSKIPTCW